MSKETADKVRCIRAECGLCADHECYHNEPHERLNDPKAKLACTAYQHCNKMGVYARCVPYGE
jgi:hypothetical protein